MTEASVGLCKWAALGCCAVCVATFLVVVLADPYGSAARVYRSRRAALQTALRGLSLPSTAASVMASVQLGSVGVAFAATVLGEGEAGWLVATLVWALPPWVLRRLRCRRAVQLERQLDGMLTTLANSLRVVPHVAAAMATLPELLSAPMRDEVERFNREVRLGSTVEESLVAMSQRVDSRLLDAALTSVSVGIRLGGDLPTLLASTASALREVSRLDGVLRARTSEARAQLWVLTAFPFAIVALLGAASPGYFAPLRESAAGAVLALTAGLFWLSALVLARRVLRVRP